ncbi:hypothetical protein DF153_23390 [Burkholderia cenocepacia]|nr:hypothetical protein DF152_17445 [Burkholderia cenocepacia]RQU20279.1 hypothetical protein DF153_23390 [Burkholderia cenocepacia]
MSSPSSLHAQRSTGACAAAPAPFRVARRTVTSLRAAFAALPSCLPRVPARSIAWCRMERAATQSCRAITIRCTSLVPS